MSARKLVSDLPKPRLDDYRPLDLFLADDDDTGDHQDKTDISLDEEIARLLLETEASGLVVFHCLYPQLPDDIVLRLRRGRPVLIVLRMPNASWATAVDSGLRRAVEHRVWTKAATNSRLIRTIPDATGTIGWDRKPQKDRTALTMEALSTKTTVLLLAPGEMLDPAVQAFADLDLDVAIEPDHFAAAARDRFGKTIDWPPAATAAAMNAKWLDVAFEKAETAAEAVAMLENAMKCNSKTSRIRLEDLHGYGPAKAWGLQLAAAIAEYRAGLLPWSDVDCGALLVGPPGTGKTLYAEALANTAGLAFFPTSYAQWQATKEGHLGDVMREMRKVFADAAAASPSLLFIDEIDTLQSRGSGGREADWWRAVVNGFLECLDGSGRREGVVVLAACNDGAGLDPAVVRSGRLDRRFQISLPDQEDLRRILIHHLPDLQEEDVQPVAAFLAGSTSGADAARLAREARQRARAASRTVSGADLLAVAVPVDTRPLSLRRRIAVHEAGHAVSLLRAGITPNNMSIVDQRGGMVTYQINDEAGLAEEIDRRLRVHLSGRAAEEVILGSVSSGAGGLDQSDLGKASSLVTTAEMRLGMGTRLSMSSTVDESLIEARIQIAYADALLATMSVASRSRPSRTWPCKKESWVALN